MSRNATRCLVPAVSRRLEVSGLHLLHHPAPSRQGHHIAVPQLESLLPAIVLCGRIPWTFRRAHERGQARPGAIAPRPRQRNALVTGVQDHLAVGLGQSTTPAVIHDPNRDQVQSLLEETFRQAVVARGKVRAGLFRALPPVCRSPR